jgi:hypothetical protein
VGGNDTTKKILKNFYITGAKPLDLSGERGIMGARRFGKQTSKYY